MDERALWGAQVGPALGVQPLELFAHRLPRDPRVPGRFTFDQVPAGTEGAW